MRIVIDMQAIQTDSRFRGIGRYTNALVKAIIRANREHEIVLVLNGHFGKTIEQIRADYQDLVPQKNIRVWFAPGPVSFTQEENRSLREVNEVLREYFILSQNPDVILLTSVFEGLSDSFVMSIGRSAPHVPVASICYDLIPLVDPSPPFRSNPAVRRWYRDRLETLKKSDLVLAISEHSRREVIQYLSVPADNVVKIMAGCESIFKRKEISDSRRQELKQRFSLDKPFVMIAGSLEASKNIPNLLEAFGKLPLALQKKYQIVSVGKREGGDYEQLRSLAPNETVRNALRVTGYIPNDELVDLYNICSAFVFPSKREGFGLPPLEAMACGAPVIVSSATSLPEVVDNSEALFDPESPTSIAEKLQQVLTDDDYRERLVARGVARAKELSWENCAQTALNAIETLAKRQTRSSTSRIRMVRTEVFAADKKSILLLKLDHAGDFLLGLPAMAKIRARYPNARIDMIVGSWNKVAAETCGLFDNIYTLDYFRSKSSVPASLESEELVRLKGSLPFYDYAIDLRRHIDTRFILLALNAGQYFGYRTGDSTWDDNLTRPLDLHPEHAGIRGFFDETHICEQMIRIVDTLPNSVNDYVQLPLLTDTTHEPGTVAIFPRVGSDARQWDSARFVELVDRLAADKAVTKINLFGVNRAELDEIGFNAHAKVHYRYGLKFADLVDALARNQVCVGNNSFGVHLGSFVGCRTVAIYSGHEMPEQWGPAFGNVDVVTANVECAPCHLPTKESCPYDMRCLTSIEVGTVFDLVKARLAPDEADARTDFSSYLSRRDCMELTVRALNRMKFHGQLDDLPEHSRQGIQAALLTNLPSRGDEKRTIYIDISGILMNAGRIRSRSIVDYEMVEVLQRRLSINLGDEFDIALIAGGLHDHEFYYTSISDIGNFYEGKRVNRIVRPTAGDVYFGFDYYDFRNSAQWDLLQAWREMGVRTCFVSPASSSAAPIESGAEGEKALTEHEKYLIYLTNFDVILAAEEAEIEKIKMLLVGYSEPRSRPIELHVNKACFRVAEAITAAYFRPAHTDERVEATVADELAGLSRILSAEQQGHYFPSKMVSG